MLVRVRECGLCGSDVKLFSGTHTTVAEYDQKAFTLQKGQLSTPFQTKLGYFILQPLSDVHPKKTTPYSQVKESIRQQLLQQKKNQVMTKWVADTKKSFDVSYQVGYAPPATGTTTSSN